jgi:nucleotide-binding universal stress UspA family protein
METEDNTIIVLWDFSIFSGYALEHALRIARTLSKDIKLLHVVPLNASSQEVDEIERKLKNIADDVMKAHGIMPSFVILKGNIFSNISKYASDNKASFVVMGTQGRKGMQKVIGSRALKVIVGSSVPFLTVQNKPLSSEKYTKIAFPVDFKSENKEKLFWAIFMGKYFKSKIFIYKYPVKDKSLHRKVNTNINFAVRFLVQNHIEYEIFTSDSKSNFSKQTIEFARNIEADLIIVTTTKYITFFDYIFGASEQKIIDNYAKIPVMCVNPKANFAGVGQFMFGQ